MVYAPPTGPLLNTIVQDPAFMKSVVGQALKAGGLPVSPGIQQRLQNIQLTVDQPNVNAEQTLDPTAWRDLIIQATEAALATSDMAAKAELFPALTPGSLQYHPEERKKTADTTTLSGLSEGGGDEQPVTPSATPIGKGATTTPNDSSGVTSRPPEPAPGAFSMFNGQPQDRNQAEQAFAAEQLAKQQAEPGKTPSKKVPPSEQSQLGQQPSPGQPSAGQQPDQTQAAPEDEQALAGQLREQQQQTAGLNQLQQAVAAMQQAIQDGELGDDESLQGDMQTAGKAANSGHKGATRAVEGAGERIGNKLRNGIKNGDFKAFEGALLLAIIKDIIDCFDPSGITPFIVNCIVTSALAIILAGQNDVFIQLFVKKYIGMAIVAVIAEFIPGLEISPTYTIGVIAMKIDCDLRNKRNTNVYEAITGAVTKLKKGHTPNASNE